MTGKREKESKRKREIELVGEGENAGDLEGGEEADENGAEGEKWKGREM